MSKGPWFRKGVWWPLNWKGWLFSLICTPLLLFVSILSFAVAATVEPPVSTVILCFAMGCWLAMVAFMIAKSDWR